MNFIKITNVNGEVFVNLALVQAIEFKKGYLSGDSTGEAATLTLSDGEQTMTFDPGEIKLLKESVGIEKAASETSP